MSERYAKWNGMCGALIVGLLAGTASGEPGQGVTVGRAKIRPYVEALGFYDSNVYQTDKSATDDWCFDGALGLKIDYTAVEMDANAEGFVGTRNYAEETDLDFTHGGEILKVRYGSGHKTVLQAVQSFRRVEDIDRHGFESAVGGGV